MKKISYLLLIISLFSCNNEEYHFEENLNDKHIMTRTDQNRYVEIYDIKSDYFMDRPVVDIIFYEYQYDKSNYSDIYFRDHTGNTNDDKEEDRWRYFGSRYTPLNSADYGGNFRHEYYDPSGLLRNVGCYDFRFISSIYPRDTIYHRGFIYTEKFKLESGQYAELRPVTVNITIKGMDYFTSYVIANVTMDDNSIDQNIASGFDTSYSESITLSRNFPSGTISHSLCCNVDSPDLNTGQVRIEVTSPSIPIPLIQYHTFNSNFGSRTIKAEFHLK